MIYTTENKESYNFSNKMSNRKNPSSFIYSPLRIESDQKDVIIGQLKEQLYHLKKNQKQYYLLEEQYKRLEHKYRLLSEEKAISDADFKDRHEVAVRNIYNLKNQIEAIKAQIRDRGLQLDDLQTDEGTLKSQIDQRLIEIDKLKNELNCLYADGDELTGQKSRFDGTVVALRKENEARISALKNFQFENDTVRRKTDDLDKYLSQLKVEENILKEKILAYENENNNLDADVTNTVDDINNLGRQIQESQNQVKNLQADIAEVSALADKYKSQALHHYKATQNEVMKNNDFNKMLGQAQNTLKVRINQVQSGRGQVGALRVENDKLDQVNLRLAEDLQYCQKHLENLSLLNSDLVMNLERFSQEDEVVRNLIDRKGRVQKAKLKVQQVSGLLTKTRHSQISPARSRTTSRY